MWLDYVQNPKVVSSIFHNEIPSLEEVEVMNICLDREGPSVTITFDIKDFPSKPPSKWASNHFNKVQLTWRLYGIEDVKINRWSTTNIANIQVDWLNEEIGIFEAKGNTTEIKVFFRWIQVGVNAYLSS